MFRRQQQDQRQQCWWVQRRAQRQRKGRRQRAHYSNLPAGPTKGIISHGSLARRWAGSGGRESVHGCGSAPGLRFGRSAFPAIVLGPDHRMTPSAESSRTNARGSLGWRSRRRPASLATPAWRSRACRSRGSRTCSALGDRQGAIAILPGHAPFQTPTCLPNPRDESSRGAGRDQHRFDPRRASAHRIACRGRL